MPVWRPPNPGYEGFARFDLSPEVEKGLTFRPLAVTAADTLGVPLLKTCRAPGPPQIRAHCGAGGGSIGSLVRSAVAIRRRGTSWLP